MEHADKHYPNLLQLVLWLYVYFVFDNIPPQKQRDSKINSEDPVHIYNFKGYLLGKLDREFIQRENNIYNMLYNERVDCIHHYIVFNK